MVPGPKLFTLSTVPRIVRPMGWSGKAEDWKRSKT
jgi:hypothetical protein